MVGVIVCATCGFLYAVEAIIFNKAKHINTTCLTHYLNIFSTILFPFCVLVPFRFS